MPETKTVWVLDSDNNFALINQSDHDTWKVRGWSDSAQPVATDDGFVWLQHEVTGGKARFATAVVEQWGALGWHPTAPPEPIDLTKDPRLVDVKEEPTASDAKKSTKAASGGSTKES